MSNFEPPKMIEDFAKTLIESIPPGVRRLQEDLEKNVKAAAQSTFSKMDLITREEFDIQQALLVRLQARVVELEAQVRQLEAVAAPTPSPESDTDSSSKEG